LGFIKSVDELKRQNANMNTHPTQQALMLIVIIRGIKHQ